MTDSIPLSPTSIYSLVRWNDEHHVPESVRVLQVAAGSGQAIAAATDFIKQLYGPEYSTVRKFKTKSASAQEAHEAIRPTDITRESVSSNEYDQKLYDLIRRRTLASQMSPAKLEKTTITIAISSSISNLESRIYFEAKGEVIIFDGFLRVYGGGKEESLPKVTSGDTLDTHHIEARQTFARPPARYTEGSLVKKLEDLGIGRVIAERAQEKVGQTRDHDAPA